MYYNSSHDELWLVDLWWWAMWGHTSTTHNSSRGKLWYKVVYFYVFIALLFFYFFGEKQTHTTKGRGWDSNIKSQPQTYLKPLINKPCYFSCDKDIYPISRQQPKTSQIFLEGWSQSLNLSPSFVKLSKILNTIDKFFFLIVSFGHYEINWEDLLHSSCEVTSKLFLECWPDIDIYEESI